jgi:uncharacterized protein (DUF1015 family)
MAVVRAFKALRPEPKIADKVASVPYDVVTREEAALIAKDNLLSFLRITRAEIELEEGIDPYSKRVYLRAKENLERIRKDAPLLVDKTPHFYIYKLVMDNQIQIGIAATFSVEDYNKNIIMKHEKTRKEKEEDRTNHIITTEAQTGPVFLTYKGIPVVNEIVDRVVKENEPVYDFTAEDGIRHTIWILPDEFNGSIINEISGVKNLYIADGHHRAASAGKAQKFKRENNPHHIGREEYNFFLAVLFPAEQLKIMPYNRVVYDLNGLSADEFMNKITGNFKIEKGSVSNPIQSKTFSMYFNGKWFLIKPRKNAFTSGNISDNLDVSILQNYLLKPVLGIEDPRTNNRIDFIGGIKGTAELERIVNSGKAAVAFSLFPVSVEDLMKISNAGEIMPPKSTWFEPKLRDGLLVHLI